MKIRYKLSMLMIGLMLIGCLFVTQSYALWIVTKEQTNENEVEVGCFSIGFTEQSESIKLDNTYPVNDSIGLSSDPYTFTITNTCTINNNYVLTLNTISTNTLDVSKIKYALYKSGEEKPEVGSKLSRINTDLENLSVENLGTSYIIDTGVLSGGTKEDGVVSGGEEVTYNLYLWIDESAGNEVEGQSFEASINVINTAMDSSKMPADEYIKRISIVENGDGLYKVSHNDLTELGAEWNKTEYRYAGSNPNNYVRFNDEIWRIIGLVNVKTENGIEQRVKIIRTNGIEGQKDFSGFSWDYKQNTGSSEDIYGSNDWTDSQLKDMLNEIYYESEIGNCYQGNSVANQCDFTGNGTLTRGLNEIVRNMIDSDIIWNLAGHGNSNLLAKDFYEKERSSNVYTGIARSTEWSKTTDVGNMHNGIALIYPSDYGYAVGGSERDICLTKNLADYSDDSCKTSNWLKPSSAVLWTLTPFSGNSNQVFFVSSNGSVNEKGNIRFSSAVQPTIYLKSIVKILNNPNPEKEYGSIDNPFVLEA